MWGLFDVVTLLFVVVVVVLPVICIVMLILVCDQNSMVQYAYTRWRKMVKKNDRDNEKELKCDKYISVNEIQTKNEAKERNKKS